MELGGIKSSQIFFIFVIVLLIYLALVLYYFVFNIVKKNINERVDNGLLVFNNKIFSTQNEDFPTEYFNQYYQKNLPLKIADFYWASSRKSYQAVGESYDFPSYQAIEKVLTSGARLINLDIYSEQESAIDANAIPIVRNQTINPLANPLNFKRCLETIKKHAWEKNAEYPLILYLEIQTENKDKNGDPVYNQHFLQRIGKNILDVFGPKLINKKYGFNGRNNKFTIGEIPIEDVLGRVIILTNLYPSVGILNEITNGVVNAEQQYNRLIPYSDININYGGLRSTHQDKQSVIQHNYKYLTLVTPVAQRSLFNFFEPKEDIYNIPAKDAWDFGCQMVLMNYQLLDSHMKDYLEKFSESSIVLKPENLRYIPRPPPKIEEQKKPLYFGPRQFGEKGWSQHFI